MLPVIALVGRPNVGKSTLFNRLTRSRDALVADYPGLTRDRQYGFGKLGERPYVVVDTGGLEGDDESLQQAMSEQTHQAIDEADAVVFIVDYRDGLTAADERIGAALRRRGKAVHLVVNKAEGVQRDLATAEFHGLGLGDPVAVSALHGDRVAELMGQVLAPFGPAPAALDEDVADRQRTVAVVGRPNVGKSTLINRLLGENRLLTFDQPGTTRDSVRVPLERDGEPYVLLDTAGLRRKGRVTERIEKFSIVQTLKAIDEAGVVIFLLDAREGVTDQDVSLIGMVLERGRPLVVGVNKWDGLSAEQRRQVRDQLDRRLSFLNFAQVKTVSALHGSRIDELLQAAAQAEAAAGRALPTPQLNDVLRDAVAAHPPPVVRGRRVRLRYAHQGGRRPPLIVVHGSQANRLPAHYRRYLINTFRKAFDLIGTPIRLELKQGDNPFAGRRNPLTPRQQRKRERLLKHVKRRR